MSDHYDKLRRFDSSTNSAPIRKKILLRKRKTQIPDKLHCFYVHAHSDRVNTIHELREKVSVR